MIDALTQVKTALDPESKEHDRVVELLKTWETYEERMRADGYEFIATEHGCGWLKKLNLWRKKRHQHRGNERVRAPDDRDTSGSDWSACRPTVVALEVSWVHPDHDV
jgi:hypothetical protein